MLQYMLFVALPDPIVISEQKAFQRETAKLWDFAENKDVFAFRTVEDVLKENQELKDEVKWLNDVITNNISKLTEVGKSYFYFYLSI